MPEGKGVLGHKNQKHYVQAQHFKKAKFADMKVCAKTTVKPTFRKKINSILEFKSKMAHFLF